LSLSLGKELSFSSDIVRKDGDGRLTLKIDLLQFNMSIRALLDTGATTSTLGSEFADKVKVGKEESARQFHGSTMKFFTVDKSLEISIKKQRSNWHQSHRMQRFWEWNMAAKF
jgi:hypothetical protein